MISIWVNHNHASELFTTSLFSSKSFFIKMVNIYQLNVNKIYLFELNTLVRKKHGSMKITGIRSLSTNVTLC